MSAQAELYRLIKRPLLTEKSTRLAQLNQYVFEVEKSANKIELTKAFELAFPGRKVTAVRLVKVPGHAKRVGKKMTQSRTWRKAIFSITGEPLEFFTEV